MAEETVSSVSESQSPATQEKKMAAPTQTSSKNPFVLMTNNPIAGYAFTAALPILTGILCFFLFKSTPAPATTEKKTDDHAQQVQQVPHQPQQLAYYQPHPQQLQPAPQYLQAPVAQPAGYLPAPVAAAPVSMPQGSSQFVVLSAGKNSRGWVFLNDTPDYRVATRTVVIKNPVILGQWAANLDSLKGRVITATGAQGSYNGKPQIDATSVTVQ